MKKRLSNLVLFTALILTSNQFFAQTSNEILGTSYKLNDENGDEQEYTTGGNISTGDYNTIIGDGAGSTLSSGSLNVMLGTAAGANATTSSDNIFIGARAGFSNTTGTDNIFIGRDAGYSNTATDNTFIGTLSGFSNTTGFDNVFIGEESGKNNTTGDDNVFIGEDAGYNNTTADDNTFVGNNAGRTNTTGGRNAALGNQALYDVSTGDRNTAVGDSAGVDIGQGRYNTMIGQAAGAATEHADYNTFVGARAGWDNNRTNGTANGNRNTYLGFSAGFSNRIGEDNVGIGAYADFDNTARYRTTFVGADATPSQSDVVMLGYSGYNDGQYSISVGNHHDVRGTNSVVLGYLADTEAAGDYIVALGNEVNVDNKHVVALGSNTIGQVNGGIAIGYEAIVDDTTNDNAVESIAIGYQAKATDSTAVAFGSAAVSSASNAFVIGNSTTNTTANTMLLGGVVNPFTVAIGTETPNTNASLHLGANDKGLLLNKMTTAERTAFTLSTTDNGMMVYDTDLEGSYVWNGTAWIAATSENTDAQKIDVFELNNTSLKLSLEGDGESTKQVDLSSLYEGIGGDSLTLNNNYLKITNSVRPDAGVNLAPYLDNTDSQTVDVFQINSGNLELSLSGDAEDTKTVDLSSYLDNTDAQQLSLSSNTLGITGNATTVDLSGYLDNTDTQALEFDDITNKLYITGSGSEVDLSSLQDGTGTDSQSLSLSGSTLSISGGNNVDLAGLADGTGTDNQNLTSATLSGTTLTVAIENGTSVDVDLSSLLSDIKSEITSLKARVTELEGYHETLNFKVNQPKNTSIFLSQNIPNPFSNTSIINYYIPIATKSANLVISDLNGRVVQNIEITDRGKSSLTINGADFEIGTYLYSLYINYSLIDTKRMVIE